MYYKSMIESVVRLPPKLFDRDLKDAILEQLKTDFEGQISPELGRVVYIIDVNDIEEGVLIPGDGAAYHKTTFTAINFLPENNEIIEGRVKDIAKFGAFVDFGSFEGMVHLSQAMNDFCSLTKQGSLQGKDTKRVLKVGDKVRARIVAVSFKEVTNPKIGLTMRQTYLGKLEWIEEDLKKAKKVSKK
jgi:DNA-directed RNA polymerase subunit E'